MLLPPGRIVGGIVVDYSLWTSRCISVVPHEEPSFFPLCCRRGVSLGFLLFVAALLFCFFPLRVGAAATRDQQLKRSIECLLWEAAEATTANWRIDRARTSLLRFLPLLLFPDSVYYFWFLMSFGWWWWCRCWRLFCCFKRRFGLCTDRAEESHWAAERILGQQRAPQSV